MYIRLWGLAALCVCPASPERDVVNKEKVVKPNVRSKTVAAILYVRCTVGM